MPDAITITSGSGSFGLNVASATTMNGMLSVIIATNQVGTYQNGFLYLLQATFEGTSSVTILDATTGQSYVFQVSSYMLAATGLEPGYTFTATLIFDYTSVSSPFPTTLTGTLPPPPCFAAGTGIATPAGPVAVQFLAAGDKVTTTTGTAYVAWVGKRHARNVDAIRIRAGTLGAVRDLIVSEDHAVCVDGSLVPAGLLVDGSGIVRERHDGLVFYHVELGRHAILLADGVEAESYLDTGNRRQFGNCSLTYDPVTATGDPCAEMVMAGSRLAQARASASTRLAIQYA